MNKAMRIFGAIVPALLAVCFSMPALAAKPVTNVTAATYVGTISNSNIASGTWVTLTGPSMAETANSGIQIGTIVLNAPTGFNFNTAAAVTVTVTKISGVNGNDITLSSPTATVTATTITINVASTSTVQILDQLTWSGIQIMPTACLFPAPNPGNITISGTSITVGGTNLSTANAGALTETGSTAMTFIQQPTNTLINTSIAPAVTLNACGSGLSLPTVTVALTTPGSATLGGTLSATTSNTTGLATFSNLAVNLAGTYTLTATSSGLTSAVSSSFIIYNPVPTTTSISPVSANAGAAGFIMTVNGTNFVTTSVVYFAGTALTTTYVSATQLTATVPAGLLTTVGTYYITVVNPAISGVGGGTSNAQVFTVIAVISPVSSFNAFDTGTLPAGTATSGYIMTKISGSAFALDVVALTATPAVYAGFTGTVQVELVDGNNGASCATYSTIQLLPNQTFVAVDNGRHNIASITEPNAWKNVYVRISYPVASPTIVRCSNDDFAIRPSGFALLVQDLNRTTAGTTNTLSTTTVAGTPVHNAGQPFTVQAMALNAATPTPATTINYTGTPTIVLSACAGTACPTLLNLGTFSIGTGTAVAGVINSTTASYSEVGSFNLTLQDTAFASVDSGDTLATCAGYYICSSTIPVGRFVPDHFAVSAASVYNRSDICALGCGTFTYMGEPMAAGFTLTAQAAGIGNTTTKNYAGVYAKLDPTAAGNPLVFGAVDSTATPTYLTARLDTSLVATGSFALGVANVSAPLMITRSASADGNYASLDVGIAPTDSDGVIMSAYDLDTDAIAGNDHTKVARTEVRYGRLNIANAHGSELLQLPIAVTAQYWNGTSYLTNTQDSATTLSASTVSSANWTNITPGNWQKLTASSTWPAGATSVVPATASINFTSGTGKSSFTLTAPGTGITGSVDMIINSSIAPTYLPSNTARATFGVYKGAKEFIYLRENY